MISWKLLPCNIQWSTCMHRAGISLCCSVWGPKPMSSHCCTTLGFAEGSCKDRHAPGWRESSHAPLDPSQEQKPATVNQAVNLKLVHCSKVNIALHVWLIMVPPWGWAPGSSSCRVKPIHSWPPSDTFMCLTHRQPQRVRATVRNTLSDPGSSSPRHSAPVCPTSAPHFILETPSRARHVGLV